MAASSQPLKKPASRPIVTPTMVAKKVDSSPTTSETRAPYTAREKMSRPSWSVPSR